MSNLTLEEALHILRTTPKEDLPDHSEFWEFAAQIDKTGSSLLRDKGDSYLIGMTSLIQSIAASMLITQGDDIDKVLRVITDDTTTRYAVLIMKLAIGLGAMEEMR